MERATAINLILLGGGLTMVGATMTLNDHNRRVACERAHANDTPAQAGCEPHGGASGSGGHGYFGSRSGSVSEASISRGGFGGFGRGMGGGHGGGGE